MRWRRARQYVFGGICLGAALIAIGLNGGLFNHNEAMHTLVQGARAHDFGDRAIDGPIELEHVFHLVNDSDKELQIERAVTTCGCTKAGVSVHNVPAHGEFRVTASLKLTSAGAKREEVRLICKETEPIVLTLQARARMLDAFFAVVQSVRLTPLKAERLLIVQLRNDNSAPESPRVEAPLGVFVSAGEWEMAYPANLAGGRPSRWQAWISLHAEHEVSRVDSILNITDGLGRTERISLDGVPIG